MHNHTPTLRTTCVRTATAGILRQHRISIGTVANSCTYLCGVDAKSSMSSFSQVVAQVVIEETEGGEQTGIMRAQDHLQFLKDVGNLNTVHWVVPAWMLQY